jgi:type 1 glutamine amidotransferase
MVVRYSKRAGVASASSLRYLEAMTLALLAALPLLASPQQPPLRALVVSGANNHEWQWTSPEIASALTESGRFAVTITNNPATDLVDCKRLAAAGELHVIVLDYNGPRWGEAAERGFLDAVTGGVGVTVVHAANNAFKGWTEYERLVGLLWRDGTGHGAYHPFDVNVVDRHHPVTAGMPDLRLHPDELYHQLVLGEGAEFRVLLSAFSDPKTGGTGRHEPMATVATFGKGRVFHTPLGHVWKGVPASRATWLDPQLRRLVARGTEWAASGAVTLDPRPLNWLSDAERAEGFQSLFDGREPAAWRGYRNQKMPAKGWAVREAAIVCEKQGGGGDLVSNDEYGDFDFRFSFRVTAKANSGVMWHVQEEADQTYMSGPEYQVLDDEGARPDPKHGVGALYDLVAPTGATVRKAGAWNDGRILVKDGRVTFWLNGAQVVDAPCRGPEWDAMVAASKFRSWPFGKAGRGRLALQDHGDEVAYRNLRVRAL